MKILKQSTLLLTGLLLFAITSCKKTDVASANENPLLTSNTSASVASSSRVDLYKVHYDIDLSAPGWSEYNSCTGEVIKVISGIWHIDALETIIVPSNRYQYHFHTNVSNYKLINTTTGIEYTGSYTNNFIVTAADVFVTGNPYEISGTLTVLLTTSGKGNNSKLIANFHITVDANGNYTILIDNYRAGCQ